jgi:Icc-related predicted phosphoesterase
MKLIVLTDLHGESSRFKKIAGDLEQADYIILCGDITHFGKRNEIEKMIRKLSKYNSDILAVTGNCDYPEVDDYLTDLGINVATKPLKLKNYIVVGLNGSLPCPGKTPNEFTETDYAEKTAELKNALDDEHYAILVSHQPPKNTKNDMLSDLMHAGSAEIRKFIEETKPIVCFSGHIHEGIGVDSIGSSKIVNPGPFMHRRYAKVTLTESNVEVELAQY